MSDPAPTVVAEYRRELARKWVDVRAFLADRRRILADPTCMLDGAGLSFPPLRFTALVSMVLPAALTSVVLLVATALVPPPPPAAQRRVDAIVQLRAELGSTFGDLTGAPAVDAASRQLLHKTTQSQQYLDSSVMPHAVEPARIRFLERIRELGAMQRTDATRAVAAEVGRELERSERLARLDARLEAAGWTEVAEVVVTGLVLLLGGVLFRWLVLRRRAYFAHAELADRVYFYYLPARQLGLWIIGTVVVVFLQVALVYQDASLIEHGMRMVLLYLLVQQAHAWFVCAPTMAAVLAGAEKAPAHLARGIARRIVASFVLTMLLVGLAQTLTITLLRAIADRVG